MNKKNKQYELTVLFNINITDEDINNKINSFLEEFKQEGLTIVDIKNYGRYETIKKKNYIKINMICITFTNAINMINRLKIIMNSLLGENILNYIIVEKENKIIKSFIDYKKPIEMKKYIFESLRIMPIELTSFSKKTQKCLAKNIKRARILGLIGRINK